MSNDILAVFTPDENPRPWFWRDPWVEWSYLKSLPEPERVAALNTWTDILTLWNHHSALPDPPPTDPLWSLLVSCMPKDDERSLAAALDRTAARFTSQWRVLEAGVRQALREEREASRQTLEAVKRAALRVGLVLALGEAAKRQTIRVGEKWIYDLDGRRGLFTSGTQFTDLDTCQVGTWTGARRPSLATCAPISLPLVHFEAWLHHEAIDAAEAWLLNNPYPATAKDPLDEAVRQDEEQMDRSGPPLVDMPSSLGDPPRDAWTEILQTVTPSLKETLQRLRGLLRHGLRLSDAKQMLAEVRNEGVGAIDAAFTRLRHRPASRGKRRSRL